MTSLYVCPSCGASWLADRYTAEPLAHSAKPGHLVVLEVQPAEDEVVRLPAPPVPAVGPHDYMERYREVDDDGDPMVRQTARILAGTARRPAAGDCLPDGSS